MRNKIVNFSAIRVPITSVFIVLCIVLALCGNTRALAVDDLVSDPGLTQLINRQLSTPIHTRSANQKITMDDLKKLTYLSYDPSEVIRNSDKTTWENKLAEVQAEYEETKGYYDIRNRYYRGYVLPNWDKLVQDHQRDPDTYWLDPEEVKQEIKDLESQLAQQEALIKECKDNIDAATNPLPVKSLEGLQYATNLSTIIMHNTEVHDISPLQGLNNLKVVDFYENEIDSGYDALYHLPSVSKLVIDNAHNLNDMSFVSHMPNLKTLFVPIASSDISLEPIATSSSIEELYLYGAGANNRIQELKDLPKLRLLVLRGTGQRDLSFMTPYEEGFKNLKELEISRTPITSLRGIDNAYGRLHSLILDPLTLDLTTPEGVHEIEKINAAKLASISPQGWQDYEDNGEDLKEFLLTYWQDTSLIRGLSAYDPMHAFIKVRTPIYKDEPISLTLRNSFDEPEDEPDDPDLFTSPYPLLDEDSVMNVSASDYAQRWVHVDQYDPDNDPEEKAGIATFSVSDANTPLAHPDMSDAVQIQTNDSKDAPKISTSFLISLDVKSHNNNDFWYKIIYFDVDKNPDFSVQNGHDDDVVATSSPIKSEVGQKPAIGTDITHEIVPEINSQGKTYYSLLSYMNEQQYKNIIAPLTQTTSHDGYLVPVSKEPLKKVVVADPSHMSNEEKKAVVIKENTYGTVYFYNIYLNSALCA